MICGKKIPPIAVGKQKSGESIIKNTMTKVRKFVEITPNLPFTEYNFYEEFRESFEKTELGRMKKVLPLHEMAGSPWKFGLIFCKI